ncbi:uncharacterized protein LOC114474158 [Gouania willdenowi]|uniref:uncharacterized protein LOC114474158 n=1 Tax=Gouania willdenowi TaxID=441366 RepID=UPI001054E2FE|nr:uncharacterized protein LOC114474158 [Gouania willdenowi]
MEYSDDNTLVGPMAGHFYFKKQLDGSLDKSVVLCKLCEKEFAYHRNNSSLRYHLNAKHVGVRAETTGARLKAIKMEDHDESTLVGPMAGHFHFKKRPDGSVDKSVVLCKVCEKEFAYHRSISSLRYHLKAKHAAASTDTTGATSASSSGTNKKRLQPKLDKMTGKKAKKRFSEVSENEMEQVILQVLRTPTPPPPPPPAPLTEDEMFLRGLLPALQKVPQELKEYAKFQIHKMIFDLQPDGLNLKQCD